ncbi:MAG TPA: glycerophosphodiester phosphodiesterase [Solirubrobacterales bacterium]|nr:glycerophosphodiester phosphodiesterase [Solirubrobacterales bacterium]
MLELDEERAASRNPLPGVRSASMPTVSGARQPALYAHRLGGAYGPESSRAGLERSLEHAVDGVEVDVVLSGDGDPVCIHDPFLELAIDREGWAHETPTRELLSAHLLDGSGKPSDESPIALTDLLAAVPAEVSIQVDVKAYADSALARETAARTCELVSEAGIAGRVEVISFFAEGWEAATDAGFPARIVTWSDHDPDRLAALAAERGLGVSAEGFIVSARLWAPLEARGVGLSVGGVNSVEQFALLPGTPEIVVSDAPHLLGPGR